jgi:hypothetical protein
MNLIISRSSVLVIIPTTLEVDEGKENEDLSRQKTVFAVTENVSVGIGTLAALLERLAYNIMLVKNIFKINFKLLQVYY